MNHEPHKAENSTQPCKGKQPQPNPAPAWNPHLKNPMLNLMPQSSLSLSLSLFPYKPHSSTSQQTQPLLPQLTHQRYLHPSHLSIKQNHIHHPHHTRTMTPLLFVSPSSSIQPFPSLLPHPFIQPREGKTCHSKKIKKTARSHIEHAHPRCRSRSQRHAARSH